MINKHILVASSLALASLLPFSTAAIAASGGGSSSDGAKTPSCNSGTVWNEKTQKCERQTASKMDDKSLYTEGRDLALAGRYQQALTTLGAVHSPDSMTYTMIGYSWRKMGNYDKAQAFYAKALAADPNNVNTHEYLGEAYAEQHMTNLAKAELEKVRSLAGPNSEQYRDLADVIKGTVSKS